MWQMHARNLLLIVLTVFQEIIPVLIRKVVAKKKICNAKNPLRLPRPWKSENRAVRNGIHLRKYVSCTLASYLYMTKAKGLEPRIRNYLIVNYKN